MNKLPKRIIIVGSGWSIRDGDNESASVDLPIWEYLKREYTIGLNYAYRYLNSTIECLGDYQFYAENKEAIDKLPFVIARHHPELLNNYKVNPNTTILKPANQYHGLEALEKGLYKGHLTGIFAITLAVALRFTEIYLLGYDYCALGPNNETHFYQNEIDLKEKGVDRKIKYQGVGVQPLENGHKAYRTSTYNSSSEKHFAPFKKDKSINIINVSPDSKINTFPKIDYNEFYKILKDDPRNVLQSRARSELEEFILQRIKK